MMTQKEMERLATIGQLCWGCDNAPIFEDSRYCEACLSCGWCKQESTGERAPSGCALCADHARIWAETL